MRAVQCGVLTTGNKMDVELMFDSQWLKAAHLQGQEHTVVIEKVEQGELKGMKGETSRKPVLRFKDRKLPLAINKTIKDVLKRAWGKETDRWVGKKLILYPTVCDAFGTTMECIRVKIPAEDGQ